LWFRDRVSVFLNEKDLTLFHDLLDRDDGWARKNLTQYINQTCDVLQPTSESPDTFVYFYKTFYDKIIEEEVIVAELVTAVEPVKPETPPPTVTKKKVKKKGKADKKKRELSKDESENDAGEEDDPAEADAVENGQDNAEEMVGLFFFYSFAKDIEQCRFEGTILTK